VFTIKSLPSYILHATILWIFYSKLGDLDSRLGGCGTRVISDLFSNMLEDKDKRFKIKLTLGPILQVNLDLGGYYIWSASLIAPHIKKTRQLLGA
jgi:hypothetical protein